MTQPIEIGTSWQIKPYSVATKIIVPQWAIITVFIVIFLLPIEIPLWIQMIPLVLSTVFLGLPHGAVDHLIPGWVKGKPLPIKQMTVLLIGYLGLVAAVIALWIISPALTFVGFILMTWWHWGTGDLEAVLSHIGGDFLITKESRFMTAIIRGGLPMLLPLIFFPMDYQLAADGIISIFGLYSGMLTTFFAVETRLILGFLFVVLIAVTFIRTWRFASQLNLTGQWYAYVFETTLLILFFSLVPPFLAVGIYFCIWHSFRHILRMIQVRQEDEPVHLKNGLIQFMMSALATTLIALSFLGGLYLVFGNAGWDLLSLISIYLALIAALTLPHTVIVSWLDYLQGIWKTY